MTKKVPKCIKDKTHLPDYLIEIYRTEFSSGDGKEEAVYWCRECGSVVVDEEYDGRKTP